MDKEVIFACSEHIEQAIDDYVNFQEAAPQIIKIKDNEKCTYCHNKAEYKIMN